MANRLVVQRLANSRIFPDGRVSIFVRRLRNIDQFLGSPGYFGRGNRHKYPVGEPATGSLEPMSHESDCARTRQPDRTPSNSKDASRQRKSGTQTRAFSVIFIPSEA